MAGLPPVHDLHVADIVVRNAKIYTGDPVHPQAGAVAHYGGYQATVKPSISGARQAELLGQAVAETEQHRQWRTQRGFVPEARTEIFDTCFLL
ncbi:hypothetical protein ACWGJB_40595 [Streptomyces sp. NPDC054813]